MTDNTHGQVPEALPAIQRFEVVDCIDDKHVPAVIPKPHGPWVRYEDHIAALAGGQATAAQLGVAYAEMPSSVGDYKYGGGLYTEAQMRAFADATHALRASHGQAPAQAAPAAVAGSSEFPHEKMDAVALGRYKVVSSDQSMFYRFAVVAGDGAQQLYIGREVDCQNMARKFAGAFLDGAFAYHSMTAAPPTQPEPQQEPSCTSVQLAEMVLSDCGHSSNYTPLLDRVAARIDAHVERCLESKKTPQQEPFAWHVCSVNSDGSLSLEHAAAWEEAAHEHINDAITEHDIEGAGSWVVRPAYHAAPQPAPQQEAQEPVAWLYESPMPDGSVFTGASAERLQVGVGTPPGTIEKPLYLAAPPIAQAAASVLEDAMRYRWLREGNDAKHGAAWHVAVNLYGCEWDAAIDAAMNKGATP